MKEDVLNNNRMKQRQRTSPKGQNNLACWLFFPFSRKEKGKQRK